MSERWRAIAAAGHGGDVMLLVDALGDSDPTARHLALGGLARAGALTAEQIRAALGDPDASVRRRAAQLAAGVRAVDLLASLDDPDPTVVEMAAWACGEHEQATDAVLARLIDLAFAAPDPLVREAAVAASGAIGDQRGLDAVLHGTTDRPGIRRRAVLALAAFDDERADTALHSALTDRDWQVRQAAEDVLRAMGADPASA